MGFEPNSSQTNNQVAPALDHVARRTFKLIFAVGIDLSQPPEDIWEGRGQD